MSLLSFGFGAKPKTEGKKTARPEDEEADDDGAAKRQRTSEEAPLPPAVSALLEELTDEEWRVALRKECAKPYFDKLAVALAADQKRNTVYPPQGQIFTAFNAVPLSRVKVVIIGQDPYHGPNQAHGLCFSVRRGVPTPPSLKNIYKELTTDVEGFEAPKHGNLQSWADQGVFLLNATMTVRAGKANSHADLGWQTFTDAVIRIINEQAKDAVFIHWGLFAQKKGKVVNRNRHCVLEAAHPSPLSVTKFLGCKVFSKANAYLAKKGKEPIDWRVPS